MMEVIYSDKHSSLHRYGINYDRKKFYSRGSRKLLRVKHLKEMTFYRDKQNDALARETLLKGKAQYAWPPH